MWGSLVLMGISQSLITMGGHTYLLKAINIDINEQGETDNYPFTVESINTLGGLKNQGYFLGTFAVSICMTSYMEYSNGYDGIEINILDISYRLQMIY